MGYHLGHLQAYVPVWIHRDVLLSTPAGACPFCTSTCGSKGPSAQGEHVCLYLGVSLGCPHFCLSLCTQTCIHGSLCFMYGDTLLHSSGRTTCPLSVVRPLASALHLRMHYRSPCTTQSCFYATSFYGSRLFNSVKATCLLLASRIQGCSRLCL